MRSIFEHFTFQGQCDAPSRHCSSFDGHWYYLKRNENEMDGHNAKTFGRKCKIGYHGTSLYGLRSIAVHGLLPGWNHHGEDDASAIYIHNEKCAGLCLQYVLYVHLFEDGKYIGVLMKLADMQEQKKD